MIEKELLLKPMECIDKDTILDLRGTKALTVAIPAFNKFTEVTTWSSLVRTIVGWLENNLLTMILDMGEERFVNKYVDTFNRRVNYTGIRLNSNCPVGIFKDDEIDEFISSSVYLNNQNHKLKLFNYDNHNWNVCAVYTGEIIFVISTLIEMVDEYICNEALKNSSIEKIEPIVVQITYIDRKELQDTFVTEDENGLMYNDSVVKTIDHKFELERDLIGISLQMKELILSVYKMASKYNLEKAEDIIRGIYAEDMPLDIKSMGNDN